VRNVARTFTKNGIRYFVPANSYWAWRDGENGRRAAAAGQSNWRELKERIFSYWTPDPAFTTFSSGAHIAALRPHLRHRWFAVIDLQQFFENVTRTKISRALEDIGFSRSEAFRIAGESTILQGSKHVLMRGFRQSSLLACLALERSLFGSSLRRKQFASTITIYCDDIVLSSDDRDTLGEEQSQIIEILTRSNFPVNPTKTQLPSRQIEIFNIKVSGPSLRFTDQRMWKFLELASAILERKGPKGRPWLYEKLFGGYIRSVNRLQEQRIRSSVDLG